MLNITNTVKIQNPNLFFGSLTATNCNTKTITTTLTQKIQTDISLLKKYYINYNRKEFITTKPIQYYINYYKKFKKTYPVLLQLESIIKQNKLISQTNSLIEIMFLAELKNLILTGIHDLNKLKGNLTINIADEKITYQGISQKEFAVKKHDIFVSDEKGIISSLISGPDYRTRITDDTTNVLFFVYGVDGIDKKTIYNHLIFIQKYLKLFFPQCEVQDISLS